MGEGKETNKICFNSILIKDYSSVYLNEVKKILNENFKFPWSDENINEISPFSYKKVYLLQDKVIGFLDSKIILDEAEILMIAVEKSMQGKGVGKFILNKFIKDMKKLCIKEIFLEVAEDNVKAINLYKSLGFNEFDVRKKYYKDDKNAILMKKSVS